MTIDATQALALARTASGTLATVTLVDRLHGPIYGTERVFVFAVDRPGRHAIGSEEHILIDKQSGAARVAFAGE